MKIIITLTITDSNNITGVIEKPKISNTFSYFYNLKKLIICSLVI